MHKTTYLFLLFIVLINSCNKIANKEDSSKHNGEWIWWHEKGKENGEWIKADTSYKNIFKTGFYSYWHSNGKPESEGYLINGKKNGIWIIWFDNGQISDSIQYKDDSLEGRQQVEYRHIKYSKLYGKDSPEYDDPNYYYKNIFNIKEGIKVDTGIVYFANGDIQSIIPYLNGVKNGTETSFYPHNIKFTTIDYKNGKISGKLLRWKENGLLYYEENKKEGILNGMVKQYFDNGQLYYSEEYKDGLRNGMSCMYYENGNKRRIGHWENGIDTGIWTYYDINGKIDPNQNY